jgi:inner membrane protein
VAQSLFGVALVSPIDAYRKVERSIKYGVLFITLVFTAFFLFEILASLRIHPLKYLLIGAALCLFYLALLSLSEFLIFLVSYVIAATAATSLISLYSLKVLNSGARTLIIAAGLVATYGFLYVILQLQDYSLLVGTIGLFIALAIVMYATRDIDWYARDERQGIANAPNVP